MMRPLFVGGPLYLGTKGVCKSMFFIILCRWMGSRTFQEFLGGKGMFYVFMFPENEPVNKALGCDFFASKTNTHIRKRTLWNFFSDGVFCIFRPAW
jgi:hypothetical protein